MARFVILIIMLFVGTTRFSPVIYENDLPWNEDYYYQKYSVINKQWLKKEAKRFIIDNEWWYKQRRRCLEGYTVKKAVDFTKKGDVFDESFNMVKLANDDRFIPHLGLTIKANKEDPNFGDVTITGRHYFYLNFWYIFRLNDEKLRKQVLHPRFTDLSFENWHYRQASKIAQKDILWAKTRQRGFSEEEACDCAYEFLFFDQSQTVIVSDVIDYAENTMRFTSRGLERLKNTQFYKELKRGGDSIHYKESENTGSQIYCLTSHDNPQTLSRLSPSVVKCEEIGIWAKGLLLALKKFVEPSIKAENGVKTGWLTYIGTGGDVNLGVYDMEQLFRNPDEHNIYAVQGMFEDEEGHIYDGKTGIFVPAWKFKIVDNDGNSLKAESLEALKSEHDIIKKAKDRYLYKVQNPIYFSEIFNIAAGGYFKPEVIENLNRRRNVILKDRALRNLISRGNIMWVLEDDTKVEFLHKNFHRAKDVVFEDGPDGPYRIIEPPFRSAVDSKVPYGLYRAGTDSYDRDQAPSSESRGSINIRKGFHKIDQTSRLFVASLLDRPEKSVQFYERTVKLCLLYNANNLVEYSNLLIIEWYKTHGFEYILKERPELAIIKNIHNSTQINQYGVDTAMKPYALSKLQDELWEPENINKLYDVDQITAFIRFKVEKDYNCDITMSSAWALLHESEDEDMMLYGHQQPTTEKWDLGFSMDRHGRIFQN